MLFVNDHRYHGKNSSDNKRSYTESLLLIKIFLSNLIIHGMVPFYKCCREYVRRYIRKPN